jgi:hypothetical protein
MGQIANCEYVCNAINKHAGTNYSPVSGTEKQPANVTYLMKMIDKVTNFMAENVVSNYQQTYTSKQIVDKNGVDNVVKLIKFKVTAPGATIVANDLSAINNAYIKSGQTVTITYSQELDNISTVGITFIINGSSGTFTMPKNNVKITASFK